MLPKINIGCDRKIIFSIILFLFFNYGFSQDSLKVVKLYHATNGEKWINNNNWLTNKPLSEWYGLSVIEENIIAIELPLNHLSGNIPREIGELSAIKIINFSDNDLFGLFPDSIKSLRELEYLNLSNNQLSGTINHIIESAKKLKLLNISNNKFSGNISRDIRKLNLLETLNLSNNSLNGTIPVELFRLQRLSVLNLQNNDLEGKIPRQIGNLIQLTYLDLSRNRFNSSIPKELGKLINLKERLALNHNELSGNIPKELFSLKKLEHLWLNNNHFSGILPFDIGNMIHLKSLFIYHNNFVGPLPRTIGNLRELEMLYAQNNSFGGNIPNELWFLPKLKMLKFENNQLTGSIPGDLKILKSIQSIDLSNNNIDTIKDSVTLPNSMLSFNLINNQLFCNASYDNVYPTLKFSENSLDKIIGLEKQNCGDNKWISMVVGKDVIDFGNVRTDSLALQDFWIVNSTARKAILQIQHFDNKNFVISDTLTAIEPNDTLKVSVTFSPINEDLHNDVILIEDIINKQTEFISVSGEGVEADLQERDPTVPWRLNLHPIPIPDSTSVVIKYDIPKSTNVDIAIYNLGGRPIKSLVNGNIETGYQEVVWDLITDEGKKVEQGEYLCVMQSGMFIQIQPLLIIY